MPNDSWPPLDEPFHRTLRRNVIIAIIVGVVFSLIARAPFLALPAALLALWPSLGGHFVEIAFLRGVRTRLPRTRLVQAPARIVWWLAGGAALGAAVFATAHALPIESPRWGPWWMGAPIFVGLELVVHVAVALRGRPNFYRGDG